jgi:hypothetical protein
MDYGVFLPVSGAAARRAGLNHAAETAERLGFSTVWAADRIIIPWQIDTDYACSWSGSFIAAPEKPLLESMTALAFLAGATQRRGRYVWRRMVSLLARATHAERARRYENVRADADRREVALNCCLSVEVTDEPLTPIEPIAWPAPRSRSPTRCRASRTSRRARGAAVSWSGAIPSDWPRWSG